MKRSSSILAFLLLTISTAAQADERRSSVAQSTAAERAISSPGHLDSLPTGPTTPPIEPADCGPVPAQQIPRPISAPERIALEEANETLVVVMSVLGENAASTSSSIVEQINENSRILAVKVEELCSQGSCPNL